MSSPTRSDVHVNRPLTSILVATVQKAEAFIADRAFPVVKVPKQSDRYFTYNKGDWTRDEAAKRAPGTQSAGGGWDVDNTPNYFCDVYGFHKDIAEQDRLNQDAPIDLDRDATAFIGQKHLIKKDRDWANTFFTTGVWGNTDQSGVAAAPGANQFLQFDQAASDPIDVIRGRMIAQHAASGFKPNKLVIGPRVWRVLQDHASILDRIKYTGGSGRPAVVSKEALAALLEVDEVLVPEGVYNSANKGAADSIDFIFGKKMLLLYAAPSPSILMPSAGYTFLWTGMSGGNGGARIKKFWIDEIESDRIEGEMAWDHKVVDSSCGQFFDSAIS